MFITITYIKLRSPTKYFELVYNAMKIARQLKSTDNLSYKFHGFWTKHYTITAWNSLEEMKEFARSGAHLEAMRKSAIISKEIWTLTTETSTVPGWRAAKEKLFTEGKVLKF